MSRYIDQDKVIDAVLELDTTHRVSWRDAVIDMIDDMASEDVQPVVHGEWIDMGDFEQCSVCTGTHLKEVETVYGKAIWIKTNWCPACGAKMDKRKGADT